MKWDLSKFKDVPVKATLANLNDAEIRPFRSDETAQNRKDEETAAEQIKAAWGLTAKKLPRLYHLDFVLLDKENGIRAFAEVKTRSNTQHLYPEYMIGLSKVLQAKKLSEVTGYASLLIVQWSDVTGWINLLEHQRFGWGGRKDRNDPQDLEPMAFFTASAFKAL